MQYPETIADLAGRLGLENPLRENDLQIEALVFEAVEPGMRTVTVKASDKNRGGRLFIEHQATLSAHRADELPLTPGLKQAAAEFFAPIWDDGIERQLLDALRNGKRVTIIWKDQMG